MQKAFTGNSKTKNYYNKHINNIGIQNVKYFTLIKFLIDKVKL